MHMENRERQKEEQPQLKQILKLTKRRTLLKSITQTLGPFPSPLRKQ